MHLYGYCTGCGRSVFGSTFVDNGRYGALSPQEANCSACLEPKRDLVKPKFVKYNDQGYVLAS